MRTPCPPRQRLATASSFGIHSEPCNSTKVFNVTTQNGQRLLEQFEWLHDDGVQKRSAGNPTPHCLDSNASSLIQTSWHPSKIHPRAPARAFTLSGKCALVSVPTQHMNSPDTNKMPAMRSLLRLQEGGLLLVIFVLGLLLTVFGGTVKMAEFKKNADGGMDRVTVEKNKFLNARNLTQLAKDTSFIAIMAVGMTFVIVSGGIDLSVGAIYALASVLAALTLQQFGPDGPRNSVPVWLSVPAGMFVCVGSATLCGLLNGGMIVALRVHPFIITLGTMAIFRGLAFVITKGQSIGSFPAAFRDLVRWETGGGLSLVPLAVMVLVAVVGGIYLTR